MPLARRFILTVFGSGPVRRFMLRHGMRLGASRFVAGAEVGSALPVARDLLGQGLRVSLTYLGEYTADPTAADAAAAEYLGLLEQARGSGLDVGLSIKLTQLGLDLDREACLARVRRILAAARAHGAVVEIDMEDSARVDAILGAYAELRREHPDLGVALQAYLRRSPRDAEFLAGLGARVRLVKGAYLEPPAVAYTSRRDVDRAYVRLARRLLEAGCFLAAATHDARLIAAVRALAAERGIGPDRYEVQMLRGIQTRLRDALRQEGVPVRVLVVYGREWYPWFVRRLAERPANTGLILRNLLLGSADRPSTAVGNREGRP